MAGSSFSQGDQSGHLWKSLTYPYTTSGEAATVRERAMRKSAGRVAITTANATSNTSRTRAIFFSTVLLRGGRRGSDYRPGGGAVSAPPTAVAPAEVPCYDRDSRT